jgi:hypothetical protein
MSALLRWFFSFLLLGLFYAFGCSSDDGTIVTADIVPAQGDVAEVTIPDPECLTDDDCSEFAKLATSCELARCDHQSYSCELASLEDGTACSDGNECTLSDLCLAGSCEGGGSLSCDDDNPCTLDICDPGSGCLVSFTNDTCDDGNPCTAVDSCFEGACVGVDNQCLCEVDTDCATYEDDNLCNGTLRCVDGVLGGLCEVNSDSIVTCSHDGLPECAVSSCEPTTGECVTAAAEDGIPCDDGNACTFSEVCADGTCLSGGELSCNDGLDCTADTCDSDSGCVHEETEACDECVGLACLACSYNEQCAPAGPFVGDGCCAFGDPLQRSATTSGSEVVDIESDDTFVWACGGFGARISNISNPDKPTYVGSASSRCQRIGIGPLINGDTRIFYLAHHGDSWVSQPHLWTYHLKPGGQPQLVDTKTDPDVLYEGLLWHDGYLYVANHSNGLRIYQTDDEGIASVNSTIGGFSNAWKIARSGDYLYIADATGGIKVVDITEPEFASMVAAVETNGAARDVDAYENRLYVALGGDGFDVLDISVPDKPVIIKHVETLGSVQDIDRDGNLLGIANWSHVTLRDASNYHLLATERVRDFPHFEEDLGIVVSGQHVIIGEWEGVHILKHVPGYIAPDIWIEEELLAFQSDAPNARALIIKNRGLVELDITHIEIQNSDGFEMDKSELVIPPGGAGVVEIVYTPPADATFKVNTQISLFSNDPDPGQSPYRLHVVAGKSATKLDVGDQLNNSFGFLDPDGLNDVQGLKGHVTVLAYFALF